MTRRKQTWADMPSSSDLGRLMLCEREFVHERSTGQTSQDAGTRAASVRGEREHLRAQLSMEAHHNRPRQRSRSGPDSGHAPQSGRDSRCFVASQVYGEDAPQTEELRSFRDRFLMRSSPGRQLVNAYYRVSPPVARMLARAPAAASATRAGLDMVRWMVRSRAGSTSEGSGAEGLG
ncbi:MAG: hypothetical protein A2580_18020 [Hydrogenophilales bacterium RIFOXYD1_FULL_62_11]|nr:MAG: hypothetical protein A2580_18020 [Hydrogenophilales bacterium RIFOXYD1_FULL_62_11]